jgi:hypothetical protein
MSKGATSKKIASKTNLAAASKPAATGQPAPRKARALRTPAAKPPARAREEGRLHTRVLKCTLEIANSRIFWAENASRQSMQAEEAFEAGWFGHRSLTRLRELLTNLRHAQLWNIWITTSLLR